MQKGVGLRISNKMSFAFVNRAFGYISEGFATAMHSQSSKLHYCTHMSYIRPEARDFHCEREAFIAIS